MQIAVNKTVDAKGLACPMPIVKTKKAMDELQPGETLELQATDRGSLADIQGWAKTTGHQYLGTKEEGDVLKHYLRKANPEETKEESAYAHTIQNEELQQKLEGNEKITVVDVREPAEYTFGRIPGAKSIPLADLEKRIHELNPEEEIRVICRTGTRSNLAAQLLSEKGFQRVKNVVPGMSEWKGNIEKE